MSGTPSHDCQPQAVIPWPGWPRSLAPLARLRPGGCFRDDAGVVTRLGLGRFLLELLRHVVFRVLDLALRATLGLLGLGARSKDLPRLPHSGGPLALVLPILPDLSHTFVYREVEALRALAPDTLIVVLERGSSRVVHREAAALIEDARFVPQRGVLARAALILLSALRTPRRLRALWALSRDQDGGPAAALLGKLPLREPRHPGRAFELAALLRRHRPSQIHVYGSTWSANAALGAAQLLAVPLSISSYVDFEFDYAHQQLATKFAQARFFRVCSLDCRARLARRLGVPAIADAQRRVPVLRFGIDAARLRARPAAPPPSLLGDRLNLFSACRVVPKKGLHLLPPLLAELARRGVGARWTLVGDGEQLARLEQLAVEHGVRERCEFAGPLPNEELLDRLAGTDLAILPCIETADGERDGIPVFLIEAMALGRCVLSTRVSGIPELIENGVNGWLADAAPNALADAICSLLAEPAVAQAIAARGRETALATMDAAVSAQELLAQLAAT
jgi:colanic acid/amylovoran biosynthesis glycosyltransferase